jgi:hypothetical protein
VVRHLRFLIAVVACALMPGGAGAQQPAAPAAPAAPADSTNIALARQLLKDMHQGEAIVAGIESAMEGQRRQNSQLSPVFYDSLVARMKRTVPEVLDSLAPGYARRFKQSELQEMIRFYESPVGQSLARQQAAIQLDAVQLGQRWGARVAIAVMKDFTDAGIDFTKP